MFNLTKAITRKLAERGYYHLLIDGIQGNTSKNIIHCVYDHLPQIRRTSIDVFDPTKADPEIDAPAHCTRSHKLSNSPAMLFSKMLLAKDYQMTLLGKKPTLMIRNTGL